MSYCLFREGLLSEKRVFYFVLNSWNIIAYDLCNTLSCLLSYLFIAFFSVSTYYSLNILAKNLVCVICPCKTLYYMKACTLLLDVQFYLFPLPVKQLINFSIKKFLSKHFLLKVFISGSQIWACVLIASFSSHCE